MTAINTNTAALNAQYYLAKTNKEMEGTMAKLSSGSKVNSAADDAAGLAIASRMTAQIRGLGMAVKNANDSMSLAQTAEGAMEEVTNMLQRIRELAVQSANGTMNASDRASLYAEVQALKAEIDRVANTTQFNSQNLLDGSYKSTFQIGDKAGQTVDLSIGSIKTTSLGMGSASSGGDSIVSGRAILGRAMKAGDIRINGQDVGEIESGDGMEQVLKAINDSVDNVEATAFNVVVAKLVGDGVTDAGEFDITVSEMGVGTATTFNISASNSLQELADNINAETGGVVAASINDDGKLVLSNETGAAITVQDQSTSMGAGFGVTTALTFNGFMKLTSLDGSSVQIERGNLGLSSPGVAADLTALGFNQTERVTLEDAYSVTGTTLTDVTTGWGKGDLVINGVEIYDEDIATTSVAGRLSAINNFSEETGVTASAYYEYTFDLTEAFSGAAGTDYETDDEIVINGITHAYGSNLAGIASNINASTASHGIKATINGTNLVLSGSNVPALKIGATASAGGTTTMTETNVSAALTAAAAAFTRIRLDSTNNTPIQIELGDSATVGEHGFLEQNVGAADYQVNAPTLSAGGGSSMAGLTVGTQSSATSAITTIDNAINRVNEIRGDLGALQNRLNYTVNNLSSISNQTSGAKGRIMDADFAKETSELTKQQILSQAATSMLAQANQSKQGILALLQG